MESKTTTKLVQPIVGIILLLPGVIDLLGSSLSNYFLYIAVSEADPLEKEVIFKSGLEVILSSQFYLLLILLPGIALCSYLSLCKKYSSTWYSRSLLGCSIAMLLSVPLTTIVGIYLLYISRITRWNMKAGHP